MGAVVDADGRELAKDVLAEEAVELGADVLREVAEIHDGDRLGKQKAAGDFQVHAQAERMAHDSGPLAGQLQLRRLDIPIQFGVDDGVVGASVEEKRRGNAVHFGVNEDQRMHGTKGEENRLRIPEAGWREKRKGRNCRSQRTKAKMELKVQNTYQP